MFGKLFEELRATITDMFDECGISLADARECGRILQRCPVHDKMKEVYNDERLPGEQFARNAVPKEQAAQFRDNMSPKHRELRATPAISALDTLFDDKVFWKSIDLG